MRASLGASQLSGRLAQATEVRNTGNNSISVVSNTTGVFGPPITTLGQGVFVTQGTVRNKETGLARMY